MVNGAFWFLTPADCSNFISLLKALTPTNLPFPQSIISFQACPYRFFYRNIPLFSSWQNPTRPSRLRSSVASGQAALPRPLTPPHTLLMTSSPTMPVVYTLVVLLTLCITIIYFSSAKLRTLWRWGHDLFVFEFSELSKGPDTRQVLHNHYFGGDEGG